MPERRDQGIAKEILRILKEYATQHGKRVVACKVRADVPRNISLYQSIGCHVSEEYVLHRTDGISITVVSM
ncbi:GNAT family N-acetyltransferase [Sporosarcina ureae]|uniref:GNAT family N-acetyltransferase n=1 Tax=Sporosarcina ureae TaxID=1571 RepID=UPI0009F3EE2D